MELVRIQGYPYRREFQQVRVLGNNPLLIIMIVQSRRAQLAIAFPLATKRREGAFRVNAYACTRIIAHRAA